MPSRRLVCLLAAFLASGVALPGAARAKSKGKGRARPPLVAPGETFGPPAPPPSRAAGSVLRFEPGHHVVVAEVGTTGRVFRIDAGTEITARLVTGARVRILFVEGVDGPVARKIMPGPAERPATPAPHRPGPGAA